MARSQRRPHDRKGGSRLPRRLDTLVESGRLTAQEADRLRDAETAGGADDVLTEIRARHAAAALGAAVASGNLSQDEADHVLARIQAGEHSAELRARVRRLAGPGGSTDGA